jgi:TRAP-type uncharacterized transport system fused permease subunit
VFFHAGRQSIPKSEERVDKRLLLRRAPLFIIPFGLITTLIVFKYPVMYAAGWALLVGLVLGFISKETRPSLKELLDAIIRGTRTASEIATMVIFCNMAFIAVLSLTSMAPKLGILISMLGGGVVLGVLVITMFVSLILGMVTPGTGAYMIVALLTVPGLTAMGLSVTQAHFFAIFMATLGFFTPPVAPAAIVTSRIAGVPYFGTCWESLKLATGAFILPFIFVFDSSLLGDFSSGLLPAGLSIGLAILVMIVTPIVVQRYYLTKLSWPEIVLGVASLVAFLIYFMGGHNILLAVVGVALFVLLTLSQVIRRRAGTPKHMPMSAS